MSITIKKSSRLGRYYEWLSEIDKEGLDHWYNLSLCKFVQTVFWGSILMLFGVFIFFLSIALLAYVPAYLLGFATYSEAFFQGGLALWGILLFAAFAIGILALAEYRQNKHQQPKPSLLKEWIKAKKAKICPLIDVQE